MPVDSTFCEQLYVSRALLPGLLDLRDGGILPGGGAGGGQQ